MTNYPSDLSTKEYEMLKGLLPKIAEHPRRKWEWHVVMNAIFYVLRAGWAWRMMPSDHVPWQTAYHYFRLWSLDGTWEQINGKLRERVRVASGKNRKPTDGIIDSQSAKTVRQGGECGFDGHKMINGHKRFLLTDTLGLVLKANIHEGKGGIQLLEEAIPDFPTWLKLWVDQGFKGSFLDWVADNLKLSTPKSD